MNAIISSTVKNDSINLETILQGIESKKYVIPEFQRNFVWTQNSIINLADSIIREYPISSILLMETGGNLQIPGKMLAFNEKIKGNEEIEGFYVLDGQQRLTALSEIFLGMSEKSEYYFDLLTILYELFPEDNILEYHFNYSKREKPKKFIELIETPNNNFQGINEYFCRIFSKKKENENEIIARGNFRFLSAKAVYQNNFVYTLSSFLNNIIDLDIQKKNHYINVLNNIFSKVNRYQIAATRISKNADLNLVIRIFEKINSTGVKLSLFDLINAKTFAVSNEGLGKFLTNEIHKYLNENNLPINLFDKIFEYSYKEDIYLNLGRIVRILEMISLLDRKEIINSFTKSKMLNKNPSIWFSQWNKYKKGILEFVTYFSSNKIIDFISLTGIEYFCAIYSYFLPKEKEFFFENVKKTLLSANFKEGGFSKSNISLFKDFIELADFLSNIESFGFNKYKNNAYLKIKKHIQNDIDREDVLNLQVKSTKGYKFNTIMYLIYSENIQGCGILDLEGKKIRNIEKTDYHHIFPLSESKSYSNETKKIINSIANIAVLDSNSNRFTIKDKKFEIYMKEILDVFGYEKFKEILDSNLLNAESVLEYIKNPTEEKIRTILTERADKIVDIINGYFK